MAQQPTDDQLTTAGTPRVMDRVARPVGGLLAAGATVTIATPATQVIPVSGASSVTIRGKFSVAGTLSFAFRRSPPDTATAYTVGNPSDVTVSAATEFEKMCYCVGESELAVTFTADSTGTVTFLDQMQLRDGGAGISPSGSGGKVGAATFYVQGTLTLPTGTPTYTAGDVMADSASAPTLMALNVAQTKGGGVRIDDLRLSTDQTTCTAQVRVHFYSVPRASLPTPTAADDVPYPDIFNNGPYYRGYVDAPAFQTGLTGSTAARNQPVNPAKFIQCESGDTYIYVLFQTQTGFTRAASQQIRLTMGGVQY